MKGKLLRILLCGIICLLLGALLIACGNKEEPEETKDSSDSSDSSSESASDDTEESLELDTSKFNIFFDKDFVCTFVLPKNATDVEKQVATAFNQTIKAKTGNAFVIAYEGKAEIDDTKNLVLIGNTSYAESKSAYKGLGERSGSIKIVDNKMVVAFNNVSSGKALAGKLAQKIEACENTAVNLPFSWTAQYTSLPERQEFIEFFNENTEKLDYENKTILYSSLNNTVSDFQEYCTALESIGFARVESQCREERGNLYMAFKGENDYIYAYYTNSSMVRDYSFSADGTVVNKMTEDVSGVVKVTIGPIETFTDGDMTSDLEAKYTPKIATLGSPASNGTGMGYAFLLPDGRLIVEDSGFKAYDFMYEYLKELAPNPNNIVIAAWILSHPHDDHQAGFFEFIQNHGSDKSITIERVVYNYAGEDSYDIISYACGYTNGKPTPDRCYDQVYAFYYNTRKYIPNVPLIRAHTGQILDFGNDVKIETLYTVEDVLPDEMETTNDSSMIIRVNIGGSSILMFADAAHKATPIMIRMWGDYLKSDMLQLGHHGFWSPDDGVYDIVRADVVFLPSTYEIAKFNLYRQDCGDVMEKALSYAKDFYVSDFGIVIIDLPYVIQNNKAAERHLVDLGERREDS